eukprot:scaffold11085_cov105-Isochrysis_galbana.AAC.3
MPLSTPQPTNLTAWPPAELPVDREHGRVGGMSGSPPLALASSLPLTPPLRPPLPSPEQRAHP